MHKLLTFCKTYAAQTENYSIPRLIIEFVLLDFALTFSMQIAVFLFVLIFIAFPLIVINPGLDLDKALSFLSFSQDIITDAISKKPIAPAAIIAAVFMAPVLETLIFQILPISMASKFTQKKLSLVLVSAIFFALAHVYPLLILYIFPGGVVLAWAYLMLSRREGRVKAFLVTATIHALFNLINITGAKIFGY